MDAFGLLGSSGSSRGELSLNHLPTKHSSIATYTCNLIPRVGIWGNTTGIVYKNGITYASCGENLYIDVIGPFDVPLSDPRFTATASMTGFVYFSMGLGYGTANCGRSDTITIPKSFSSLTLHIPQFAVMIGPFNTGYRDTTLTGDIGVKWENISVVDENPSQTHTASVKMNLGNFNVLRIPLIDLFE